jgi:hypothetical protein
MAETPTPEPPKAATKRGAKPGNRNNLRHGLRAGKLPLDAAHVENQCNALRRTLEDAVLAARGAVTLTDAANVATATKWERHGALCLRWLRKAKDLKPLEQLTFSREIAKASTERDKAIALLRLDRDPDADAFENLYANPAALPAPKTEDDSEPA